MSVQKLNEIYYLYHKLDSNRPKIRLLLSRAILFFTGEKSDSLSPQTSGVPESNSLSLVHF